MNIKPCPTSYSCATEDGDATPCRRIFVDGRVVHLTRNLYEGLRRIFVGDTGQLPIWVDAVCIDQSNVDERSNQMARMSQIYSNATEVICWLGEAASREEDDNIAACLACFSQRQYSHFREHRLRLSDGRTSYVRLFNTAKTAFDATHRYQALENSDIALPERIKDLYQTDNLQTAVGQVCRTMMRLCSRRYWSRRRVVQEVCKARGPVTIRWSNHSIGEEQLRWPATFEVLRAFSQSPRCCSRRNRRLRFLRGAQARHSSPATA